jgi:hypothetical protein
MPKAVRKQSVCPNCHHPLDEVQDNFCPRCGQENTTRVVSFGAMVAEVVGDFFSWDSRWFQTAIPFLFKPGHLTNEFLAGRRMRYMPPLRLYFFISLICFSILAYYATRENAGSEQKERALKQTQADSIRREVLRQLPSEIPPERRAEIQNALEKLSLEDPVPLLDDDNDTTRQQQRNKPRIHIGPKKKDADPVVVNVGDDKDKESKSDKDDKDKEERDNEGEWDKLAHLADNPALSEQQILDSLHWENTFWNRMKVDRAIRFKQADQKDFINELWDHAPLFMFLLLPFVALILKLLYVRRKRLYIEHVIFLLHFQAFAYLLIAIDLIISSEFPHLEPNAVIIPVILLYLWLAMRRVYKQGWFRTSVKMFSFLMLYCFVFAFMAVLGVVMALATF